MSQGDIGMMSPESKETRVAPEQDTQRRAYVKPAFVFEHVFETAALTCNKSFFTTS